MRSIVFAIILLVSSEAAFAGPSVFVRSEKGSSWETTKMDARILGQSVGNVTAKQLSDYIAETVAFYPYSICSIEAADADSYVGLDRDVQSEIAATLKDVKWLIQRRTPDNRSVTAQVVLFEGCDPEESRGAALLVTDSTTNEILRWEPTGDRSDRSGKSYPNWTLFLSEAGDDELFSYARCTECGEQTNVYYDVTRQKIYIEYNGH